MGETPKEKICAFCLQPIRKEELPAVGTHDGRLVHAWCWGKYMPPKDQRPN